VGLASHAASVPTNWTVEGPLLDLTRIAGGRLVCQLAYALARQVGVPARLGLDQEVSRAAPGRGGDG